MAIADCSAFNTSQATTISKDLTRQSGEGPHYNTETISSYHDVLDHRQETGKLEKEESSTFSTQDTLNEFVSPSSVAMEEEILRIQAEIDRKRQVWDEERGSLLEALRNSGEEVVRLRGILLAVWQSIEGFRREVEL